jgi:hypothetical protein
MVLWRMFTVLQEEARVEVGARGMYYETLHNTYSCDTTRFNITPALVTL